MMTIRKGIALALLGPVIVMTAACSGELDARIATLNAQATELASAGRDIAPTLDVVIHGPTPTPTSPPVIYDLSGDSTALLAHTWGEIYGLSPGAQFTITATQEQAAVFTTQTLNLDGWEGTVFNPTVALGAGQFRLDFGLVAESGYGQAVVTFQPTLNALGRVELNSLGADYGGVTPPAGLTFALGDAVHTTLTGARDARLQRVTLSEISLDNGVMQISGAVSQR